MYSYSDVSSGGNDDSADDDNDEDSDSRISFVQGGGLTQHDDSRKEMEMYYALNQKRSEELSQDSAISILK